MPPLDGGNQFAKKIGFLTLTGNAQIFRENTLLPISPEPEGVNSLKVLFGGNCFKHSHLQKSFLSTRGVPFTWEDLFTDFFAGNCIACPDLNRKFIFEGS